MASRKSENLWNIAIGKQIFSNYFKTNPLSQIQVQVF